MNERAVFDVSWLELREPLDHRSRAREPLPHLRAWWRSRVEGSALPGDRAPGPGEERGEERSGAPVVERPRGRIVDLGSGTGSNLRYLAPLLPGLQRWTLVDNDPELLARASTTGKDVDVTTIQRDLTEDLSDLLRDVDLVTGSAFLDLVSGGWLADLVDGCRAADAGAYFALSYDGDFRWYADESRRARLDGPDDGPVRNAVNAHQRRDKGFGSALGPRGAPEAARLFDAAGYRTWIRPSPWILGPEDTAAARRLVDGWEAAAVEARPGRADEVREWAEHRRAAVRRGSFGLVVGHRDLLAL